MTDNLEGRQLVRVLGLALFIFLIVAAFPLFSLKTAYAHQEGEEAPWLPVHQIEGNLIVSPDSSLSQWTESHHGHADGLDGVQTDLMSVHNETYWVILAERPFNANLSMAGVALFINGTQFNSPNTIWGWVGGQNNSTDSSVVSRGVLSGGDLTVIFGRALAPASGVRFDIGIAYEAAIKVTSWNNGTAATSLNYDMIDAMGLELLPFLDIFPRAPFVYGAVLLAGTVGFILIEYRRYRP